MKKKILGAVIVVLVMGMAASAFAASAASGTVTVEATIVAQCKVVGGNNITQTVNFGTITPDNTTADTTQALTGTNVQCTNGLPYNISYTSTNSWNMVSGGHNLPYTFTPTTASGAGTGTGFGNNVGLGGSVTVTGSNLQAAWSNDPTVGVTYQDTITISMTY